MSEGKTRLKLHWFDGSYDLIQVVHSVYGTPIPFEWVDGEIEIDNHFARYAQVGMKPNPLLDEVPIGQSRSEAYRYESKTALPQVTWKIADGPTIADALKREFGYVEQEGDAWRVFDGRLIVIHPERLPRIYPRNCGGDFYEIEPLP